MAYVVHRLHVANIAAIRNQYNQFFGVIHIFRYQKCLDYRLPKKFFLIIQQKMQQ